jgi:hypothetical protein
MRSRACSLSVLANHSPGHPIAGIQADGTGQFETGANRDTHGGKPDYERLLSPLVIEAFGARMRRNRYLKDGSVDNSHNCQKGMPLSGYMKSAWQHFFDWWRDPPPPASPGDCSTSVSSVGDRPAAGWPRSYLHA